MGLLMRKSLIFLCIASCFAFLPLCSSQEATPTPSKRPMTFDDMMKMKRLGETAVSPDGKWLAYGVTTVNLNQNTRTSELWVQKIEGGEPMKVAVARPGDSGIQFAPDGHSVLFLSGRAIGQQIWLADFDPETGVTASNAKKLTNMATEADNAQWSPDGHSVVFTSAVYPDCPPITTDDFDSGDRCNSDQDAAIANSKVKAQIFTHSLYRHWNRFMGDKRSHLFLISVESGAVRDLTPGETHDVPPYSVEGGGGFAIAPDAKELAFTEKLVEDEAISTNADIFTLDLTDPAAKPVKVSTSRGGDWSPAYSPDGKWLAWRSQERDGDESDKFRLVVYDREKGSKSASQQVSGSAIRDLLPKFDNWVDEFAWAPDSKHIYFVSAEKGRAPIFSADLGGTLSTLTSMGEFSDLHPLPQ